MLEFASMCVAKISTANLGTANIRTTTSVYRQKRYIRGDSVGRVSILHLFAVSEDAGIR